MLHCPTCGRHYADDLKECPQDGTPLQADATVARKYLLAGATLLPIGIGLAAIGLDAFGALASIAGWAVLIAGMHTFGRAGPDPGDA